MQQASIKEFNSKLVDDCKLSIEEFYANNPWDNYPRPYTVLNDISDSSESYRILFPTINENTDRAHEYYALSRIVSGLNVAKIGLVSFMEIEVPSRPELEPKFWGRTSRLALIGAVTRTSSTYSHIFYDHQILIFDSFDGVLEFCDIEDQSMWQDFINNVSIFRDYLFFSSLWNVNSPYRWPEAIKVLRGMGFEFDFTSDRQQQKFVLAQEPLVALT